jgi:serine/threonine protein kinase
MHPFLEPPHGAEEIGRLAHFRLLRLLGRGGMGMVFQAEDMHLQRAVALKVMLPEIAAIPNAAARFLREARATAAIKHENVVTIYETGEDRGAPFLAMELLSGASLRDWLEAGNIAGLGQIVEIGRGIARGLAAAHARGIIHRDIKPSNIWLEAPDGKVKILDFGLARASESESGFTHANAILGTPQYMSPEQASGLPLDHRSDLFSLGCILYQLAARRTPFPGRTPVAVLSAIARESPAPLEQVNPRISSHLAALIARLLSQTPDERPASAAEVVRALEIEKANLLKEGESVIVEPVSLNLPGPLTPETTVSTTRPDAARKTPRGGNWGRSGALLAAAVLILGLGAALFMANPWKASGREWRHTDLEKDADSWQVFVEGKPQWRRDAAAPGGQYALRLALTGGEPYSNAHFYRNLPGTGSDRPKWFTLSLRFRFSPTTYNNEGGRSTIQAIEFTSSEWRAGKRSEFALQWLNVGYQAPCWRYWDPHHKEDRWRNLDLSAKLAPDRWHDLRLEGKAEEDAVDYLRFTIDGKSHELGVRVPAHREAGQEDRVAVGIQLDGNSQQDPYELQLADVDLVIHE